MLAGHERLSGRLGGLALWDSKETRLICEGHLPAVCATPYNVPRPICATPYKRPMPYMCHALYVPCPIMIEDH